MLKNFNLESNLTYIFCKKFPFAAWSHVIFSHCLTSIHSDYVTNSYGESWDSSKCEKSWVPVHNQWVPVKKRKCLGFYVTRQLIWRQTRKFSITVYWKKYSPSIHLWHKKDWNKYASLNNNHRNHTNRIFYQKIFKSINHSKAVL